MPSTGMSQSSSKVIGALNAPQPRSPPNMRGDNRGAPEAEVQKIVANVLNVPEQEVPVYKHGHSRCCPRGVEGTPGCTAHLNLSGCSGFKHVKNIDV